MVAGLISGFRGDRIWIQFSRISNLDPGGDPAWSAPFLQGLSIRNHVTPPNIMVLFLDGNRCARKKQSMLFDRLKAIDQIESFHKSDFFFSE